MRLLLILILLSSFAFAADEKAEYVTERYFPTSWEPPTVSTVSDGNGAVISIQPSAPNFDKPTKLGAYIQVGNVSVQKEDRVKKVSFSMVIKGVVKRIYIGKIFRINNHPLGHGLLQSHSLKWQSRYVFRKLSFLSQ